MTKKEIIEALVINEGIAASTAQKAVTRAIDAIADAIVRGENVYLRGFGTFKIRTVAPKIGRNISKNEPITIPEHRAVKFIPSAEIKAQLANLCDL